MQNHPLPLACFVSSIRLAGLLGGAALFLGGCSATVKDGAQHAHFLPDEKIEVHTAVQFDMLPEPVNAQACAALDTAYNVTVLGSEKSLSKGEKAAVLQALNGLGGKADVFYLTRSNGTTDANGKSCGEVWGRALKLRTRDFVPTARGISDDAATGNAGSASTPAAASVPAVPPTQPATPAASDKGKVSDKAKMGF